MTTQSSHIRRYRPHYNLLAAVVKQATKDFNEGDESERADAAVFFRSEADFGWMLKAVNGDMERFIADKLCESPFPSPAL